jgi:plastocyanin
MARTIIIFLLAAVYAVPAVAAPLSVRVVDARGRPVRDAVVTLRPIGVAARPAAASGSYSVSQKGMQFHPFVSVVPVGASVSFPNRDATKHHVYSFSPAKRFELKLFARDQSRSVRFDKPGVIALGCNIHDSMSAFIVVTDSPWTARTDGKGVVQFANAPNAAARLSVWHPYLRAPGNMLARRIAPGRRSEGFTVNLRSPPLPMSHDY